MLRNYFKIAFRNLVKNKVYSSTNIIGLAVGTLCCLYIVLYVQDQYSYDKQHLDVNDIYRITTLWTIQGDKGNWATVTAPVAPAMKNDFAEVAQYTRIVPDLGIDHHLLRYQDKALYEKDAVFADSTLFDLFNFHFEYGNPKTALSAPYTVVLLKSTADKLFGLENPLGKVITIDNTNGKHDFTVSGVVDESLGKSHIQANLFMSMNSGGFGDFALHNNSWSGANFVISYVKLQPKTNVAALDKKLPAFLKKYGDEQLKSQGMTKDLHLEPVRSIHTSPGYKGVELTKPVSPSFLYILLLIAGLIQVIACINFMNLSTARASKRAKEVGVRKVTGAERTDLIRQFLGESLLLSFIGVCIALPLLIILLPYLNQLTAADISLTFLTDYRLWVVLASLVMITGLLAGSYPAFYLSGFQAIKVIKGNFTNHISAAGIRRSLVVFQFVLSIVLITGIIIIYSQLSFIKNKDLGFDKDQKLIFSFHTGEAVAKLPGFMADIRALAEVKTVSRANNSPGQMVLYDMHLFRAGGNMTTAPDASFIEADEQFMNATGIRLASGRDFRPSDSGKIIINESLAKSLNLTVASAPGTRVYSQRGDGSPMNFDIIGVMKNYNFSSLRDEVKPLFLTYSPDTGSKLIVSAASKNYTALLDKLETIWQKDFVNTPFDYAFMDDDVQKQYEAESTLGRIVNSFTLMAILISCLGLFGLAAFDAEQRSKEIGIRKALGASVSGIIQLLSKDFLKLVMVAFVIATPIAWWSTNQWLQGFAYRVPVSWWMFAIAGLLSLFIALFTVSFQSVKAALMNPVTSLRSE
ncbi:FtsX-like permease family protein [Spirosoma sp. HMF4905]|uniref:FtsX-like permease family protein n=2 Tax=Spirosoma arboris TaxID=2682092 RepID=A0A7K1SFF6_9BACT|nr:FtsX-like permease family protein [Spirosoma arboris]